MGTVGGGEGRSGVACIRKGIEVLSLLYQLAETGEVVLACILSNEVYEKQQTSPLDAQGDLKGWYQSPIDFVCGRATHGPENAIPCAASLYPSRPDSSPSLGASAPCHLPLYSTAHSYRAVVVMQSASHSSPPLNSLRPFVEKARRHRPPDH